MAGSVGDKLQKSIDDFNAAFSNVDSFAKESGITEQQLDALYTIAYQNYQLKKYSEAKQMFKALSLYDHKQIRFYMGLAACCQGLEQYDEAIESYSIVSLLSGLKDPKPVFYIAICLLRKKDNEGAKVALESIKSMGREGNREDEHIKAQAETLQKFIK